MTISWTDEDSAVQGYEIYRSVHHTDVDDDEWFKVGYASAGTSGTWIDQQIQSDIYDPALYDMDLSEGDAYDYKVRAITGISGVFSDSNVIDGDGSGIVPARDGYANNLAVGWNNESGGTVSYSRESQDVEAARAPSINDGWLEYDNVDLSSGATSLNLNLVLFDTGDDPSTPESPDVTVNVYYGSSPPTEGETPAGSVLLTDPTTTRTGFSNLGYGDFTTVTLSSLSIPSGTDSTNIYIQFVATAGTPDQHVYLSNWQFAHS